MSENGPNLRLYPGADVIDQLIDNVAILTTEAQARFAESYSEYSWRVDLSEPPVFWFEREPPAMFAPSFIGSTSGTSNTWLWGWENINSFPGPVIQDAERLHELAESISAGNPDFDCTELLTAKLPLGEEERRQMGLPERTEYSYVYAAMAVAGIKAPVFYRAPTGNGSYAWFLLSNSDEFSLPSPTPLVTIRALTDALSQGLLTNHKVAVQAYAAWRDGVELAGDGDVRVLRTPGGDVQITFDELGRITNIAGQQSPGQQSAGQQAPGQQSLGQQSVGQQSVGQQTHGQQVSGQQVPGQQSAGQQSVGQQAPDQQASGQQAPGQQTPGQQAPGQPAAGAPDNGGGQQPKGFFGRLFGKRS